LLKWIWEYPENSAVFLSVENIILGIFFQWTVLTSLSFTTLILEPIAGTEYLDNSDFSGSKKSNQKIKDSGLSNISVDQKLPSSTFDL
jgi:hypothetical protein